MAVRYVNYSTGSNSNNGTTAALAYLTNAYAITQTTSGDIIVVVDGTYTSITDSYTWGPDRIYMSQTYYAYYSTGVLPSASATALTTVIIDAASVGGRKFLTTHVSGTTAFYGIWIKNFNYNAANYPALDLGGSYSSGEVQFYNCIMSGLRTGSTTDARNTVIIGAGILANNAFKVKFEACLFYDNDYNSAGGNASQNGLFGLNNVNSSTASGTWTVRNCTFDISGYTYMQRFWAISTSGVTGTVNWYNNVVYNTSTSIPFCNDTTTFNAAVTRGTGSGTNWTYTLSSNPTSVTSTAVDPLFVDAPNRNYNLRPTSTAIDTGTLI